VISKENYDSITDNVKIVITRILTVDSSRQSNLPSGVKFQDGDSSKHIKRSQIN